MKSRHNVNMKKKVKKVSHGVKASSPAMGRPKQKINIEHAVKLVSCGFERRDEKCHRECAKFKFFDARISRFFLVVLHEICTATKFFNMSQRHKTPKSTRNHHHDPHHDGIDDCVATPSNLQVSLHKFVSIYLLKRYNALFLVDCCYL